METVIETAGLRKSFMIPHDRRSRLKELVVQPFRRTTYERNQALSDISFEVRKGEFFGVVGANGSGKSTLLKILAGIYRADGGKVRITGRVSPFIELGVGFNPELSARENIEINAMLLGLTRRQLRDRYDHILEFSGLQRFVDQKLKNYSSGMLVRLAYSIAIQVPFDILLLDEVLAVGDAEFQAKCLDTFEAMHDAQKTIVLVSHDLDSVSRFCERALLLHDGRSLAIGETQDVIDAYRALYTNPVELNL